MTNKIYLPTEKVIRKYQCGMSTYKLAEEYNVSDTKIWRLLKEGGVELRNISEALLGRVLPAKEIIRLYTEGKNTVELGKKYGVKPDSIKQLLKKESVKIRNLSEARLQGKKLPRKEIISLYNAGKSALELSRKYNISPHTIDKLLKKEGVERRNQSEAQLHGKKLPIGEIVSLYNKGKNTVELGRMYHVTSCTIGSLLKREGIETPKRSSLEEALRAFGAQIK